MVVAWGLLLGAGGCASSAASSPSAGSPAVESSAPAGDEAGPRPADAEEAVANQPRRKSFRATLFGLDEDENEDAEEIRVASRPDLLATLSAQPPLR